MYLRLFTCIAFASLFFCRTETTDAAPIRVVAAGDSITNGYAYHGDRLQHALDEAGADATAFHAILSGRTAQAFLEEGGVATALSHDPDVVALMLGTNDANRASWTPTSYAEPFYTAMTTIFDEIDGYVNTRGRTPSVILLNLLPTVDDPDLAASVDPVFATRVTEEEFNPWLLAQASSRGYILGDVHTLITSQPNWESMSNDGIHLWGDNQRGYELMADYVAQQVVAAVPEPGGAAAVASLALLALRRRRN